MTAPGWLTLAASPSFALMAFVSAEQSAGPGAMICGVSLNASPFGSMTVRYVLMSVFHAAPWLKIVGSRFGHPLP